METVSSGRRLCISMDGRMEEEDLASDLERVLLFMVKPPLALDFIDNMIAGVGVCAFDPFLEFFRVSLGGESDGRWLRWRTESDAKRRRRGSSEEHLIGRKTRRSGLGDIDGERAGFDE